MNEDELKLHLTAPVGIKPNEYCSGCFSRQSGESAALGYVANEHVDPNTIIFICEHRSGDHAHMTMNLKSAEWRPPVQQKIFICFEGAVDCDLRRAQKEQG